MVRGPSCGSIERTKSIMKKALKITLITLAVLVVAVILILNVFLGSIVETAIRKGGPAVLGVSVQLDDADMRILRGKVGLSGLVIGNPEGFDTDSLFSLGNVKVDIDTGSLFSDTIHIRSITIKDPKITYERALKNSNISALTKSLQSEAPKEESKEEQETDAPKPAKKVIIDKLTIEGGKVLLATKFTGSMAAPIPLPKIKLNDIGKKSNGATAVEALKQVLPAVTKVITTTVTAAVNIAGDVVGETAGLAVGVAEATTALAGDTTKVLAGGAASVTTGAVDAAAGTVKDAASTITKGADKLFGGFGRRNSKE
jgi:hypothetical protein